MYQQLWGYKIEEKLYLGVREQKRLNTTALEGQYTTKNIPLYYIIIRHLEPYKIQYAKYGLNA
jgi:hypothetical protein